MSIEATDDDANDDDDGNGNTDMDSNVVLHTFKAFNSMMMMMNE